MKILGTAYACRPGAGSEEGNGWHLAHQLARFGDVWVVTPSHNRAAIEATDSPIRFVYCDLPRWPADSAVANRVRRTHYNLWQMRVLDTAKRLHRQIGFDVVHHLTWGQYWTGSWMGHLDVPFVWGPVGGGETAPASLIATLPPEGQRYERKRDFARWVGRSSPAVRSAARTAALALATTEESRRAIQTLPARNGGRRRDESRSDACAGSSTVEVLSNCALPDAEFDAMGTMRRRPDVFRAMCVGRLEHWKGFHLAVEAFAAVVDVVPDAELCVVGTGPAEAHLRRLVSSHRLERNVKLLGTVPRREALARLANSHVLVHPSLHDSGGWATLEGAALGLPIVCLDIGGPALQVTPETGFKIPVDDTRRIVPLITEALTRLAIHPQLAEALGNAGRRRVGEHFTWDRIGRRLATMAPYASVPARS